MLTAITAGLGLAEEVFKYINTEASRKLIKDVRDIKLKILAEEGKGYLSDDPKIETLRAQAGILIEAATSELRLKNG